MTITDEERRELVRLANEVRLNAYVPYSNYRVGAALRSKSGTIYTGVNVENAVFPMTNCAERTAVFKAVSEGEREFDIIAVATDNGGSPCGACRQVLSEFGQDILVLIADGSGRIVRELAVRELLPDAFTSQDLEKK